MIASLDESGTVQVSLVVLARIQDITGSIVQSESVDSALETGYNACIGMRGIRAPHKHLHRNCQAVCPFATSSPRV